MRASPFVKLDKILVPTDLSSASADALAAGSALAAACRAKVTLLHVRQDAQSSTAALRARLRELSERVAGALVRSVVVDSPVAWQAICDYARDHDYDMIAITRRSQADAAHPLGTVAERVLRLAPCRVLVAGAGAFQPEPVTLATVSRP